MNEKVSVIVPTFNEKDNIASLLEGLKTELDGRDYEIIVVDDNSPDGTFEAASADHYPRVKVLKHSGVKGLANSIRFGIEHSEGALIVIMDSDFDHDPRYIKPMLSALPGHDCVVASRFITGHPLNKGSRRALSCLYNGFIRALTGGRLSDYLFGFIALKRTCLSMLDLDSIFYGFGDYCMRLLTSLENMKADIFEMPAEHGARRGGRSGNRLINTFFLYTIETFKLALCIKR